MAITRIQKKRLKEFVNADGRFSKMKSYSSPASATNSMKRILSLPSVQTEFRNELENLGFGLTNIASDLVDLARAEKEIPISYQGKVHETAIVKDNTTRLNTISLITKILGLQRTNEINLQQNNQYNDNSVSMIFDDLSLEQLDEIIAQCDIGIAEAEFEEVNSP
ncbi:hypothetical protein ACFL6H_09755 [Candidatus Latescibacterota bacterium]